MKLFNTIILAAGLSAVSALPTVIKRDFVVVNCNDRQIKMLNQARRLCQERGISARDVAYSYESHHTRLLLEFFKDDSYATRNQLYDTFFKVADDCQDSGIPIHCVPSQHKSCKDNAAGITALENNGVNNTPIMCGYCPIFFEAFLQDNPECHGRDKAHAVLHETTHGMADTLDKFYGYDGIVTHNHTVNLRNADTFA
jgi:hypothetical protein